MNAFIQHIPAFVELSDDNWPRWTEFETTDDLLALDVVQRYIDKDFAHFAMSGRLFDGD